MQTEVANIGVTTALAVGGLFHAHLPSLYETRVEHDETDADLRAAQFQITGFGLLVAVGVSLAIDSPVPLIAAALMIGLELGLYEFAIQART